METFTGLGFMLGPPLGGVLYSVSKKITITVSLCDCINFGKTRNFISFIPLTDMCMQQARQLVWVGVCLFVFLNSSL